MWDRLSQRERIMFIILGLVIIIAFYYLYLYQPVQTGIKEMMIEKSRKENQLVSALALVKKLPELKERYNELKEIEMKKQKSISLYTEDILQVIEEISKETGVELKSFTPLEKEDSFTLNILMMGYYKEICNFLSGFKRLENQVKFTNLTIEPNQDKLEMRIELFYEKRETDGGDIS